jgi:hypothetical protein
MITEAIAWLEDSFRVLRTSPSFAMTGFVLYPLFSTSKQLVRQITVFVGAYVRLQILEDVRFPRTPFSIARRAYDEAVGALEIPVTVCGLRRRWKFYALSGKIFDGCGVTGDRLWVDDVIQGLMVMRRFRPWE